MSSAAPSLSSTYCHHKSLDYLWFLITLFINCLQKRNHLHGNMMDDVGPYWLNDHYDHAFEVYPKHCQKYHYSPQWGPEPGAVQRWHILWLSPVIFYIYSCFFIRNCFLDFFELNILYLYIVAFCYHVGKLQLRLLILISNEDVQEQLEKNEDQIMVIETTFKIF